MKSQVKSQTKSQEQEELAFWDQVGVALSALCLAHCLLVPLVLLSLPIMARYYLLHPYMHLILAVLIVPLGLFTFTRGYLHHRKALVLWVGFPGLFLVGITPLIFDILKVRGPEPLFVSLGSLMLVYAHWRNYRSCLCDHHHH